MLEQALEKFLSLVRGLANSMIEAYKFSFTLGDIIAGGLTLFSVVLAYFFGTIRERRREIDEKSERYYQHILSGAISLRETLEALEVSRDSIPMRFPPEEWQGIPTLVEDNQYYLDTALYHKVENVKEKLTPLQHKPRSQKGVSSKEDFAIKKREALEEVNKFVYKLENYYMQYPLKRLWYRCWNKK